MILKLASICAVIQLVLSQQLPITFQDGKIGVNFGGYHAEAGLGGLLTGNAAHGGLSASAGTPSGQAVFAGLGGNSGPNARGGLYAGATAGASLAGDVNNGASFGVGQAGAYAGGVQKQVIKTVASPGYTQSVPAPSVSSDTRIDDDDDNDLTDNTVPQTVPQTVTQIVQPAVHVQKIKVKQQPQYVVQKYVHVPAIVTKTYSYQQPIVQYPLPVYQPVVYQKRIQIAAPYPQVVETAPPSPVPTAPSTTPRPAYVYTYDKQKVIIEIFSIPIHALRAVNEISNAKLGGGYAVQKTVTFG